MVIERTKNEILIRMPLNVDLMDLENMLNLLKYKELTSNSSATQEDADEIANLANQSIMEKFKKNRTLK